MEVIINNIPYAIMKFRKLYVDMQHIGASRLETDKDQKEFI